MKLTKKGKEYIILILGQLGGPTKIYYHTSSINHISNDLVLECLAIIEKVSVDEDFLSQVTYVEIYAIKKVFDFMLNDLIYELSTCTGIEFHEGVQISQALGHLLLLVEDKERVSRYFDWVFVE